MSTPSLSGQVPLGGSQPPTAHQPPVGVQPQLPSATLDPFSKVVTLPSGGLYYACGTDRVTIRPTRGEQEEMIACTPEESPDRVAVIREVVQQCTNLGSLAFDDLAVLDFGHICMHLFALSAGTDEVNIQAGCDKDDCPMRAKTLALTMLPSVFLQRDDGGALAEEPEEDPDILAARMVMQDMGEEPEDVGPEYRTVSESEPFTCKLSNGTTVAWRYHRMKDLEAAEAYARATGDKNMAVGAKLGSFLSARQIVAINGVNPGTVGALQWWKATPSPLLKELRAHIGARNFGINMRPEFRCPRVGCRKKVQVKLPNDGSLFRSGT